ncbi:MAG: crossover junction endodeoxyribonuclease RuvC [bacterium]|nr:crossover junction endodeoxyribonuclease RuvC [bacterium]
MLIIGVDPGLVCTGVGIISKPRGLHLPVDSFTFILADVIKPPKGELPARLLFLHEKLLKIIQESGAEAMAIEDQFFGNNAQTAFKTGQARGAALLAAARCGLPVTLYPPARVKMAVVGHGNASKEQVRHLVQQILKVQSLPASLDSSDALAVALCHGLST